MNLYVKSFWIFALIFLIFLMIYAVPTSFMIVFALVLLNMIPIGQTIFVLLDKQDGEIDS